MMKMGAWRVVRIVATLLAATWTSAAIAQIAAPPVHQNVDGNGVDVIYGTYNARVTDVSIGQGSLGMAFTRYWESGGWRNSLVATISGSRAYPTVSIGAVSESFTRIATAGNGSATYSTDNGNGAVLIEEPNTSSNPGDLVYTGRDGTIVRFMFTNSYSLVQYERQVGLARSITYPNGIIYNFYYKSGTCTQNYQDCGSGFRIQSVTSNLGYQIKFTYAQNTMATFQEAAAWRNPSRVSAINNAVDYCDPNADTCSAANTAPHADYTYLGANPDLIDSVTDYAGRATHYGYGPYTTQLTTVQRPGASVNNVEINYDSCSGKVCWIKINGSTTSVG